MNMVCIRDLLLSALGLLPCRRRTQPHPSQRGGPWRRGLLERDGPPPLTPLYDTGIASFARPQPPSDAAICILAPSPLAALRCGARPMRRA